MAQSDPYPYTTPAPSMGNGASTGDTSATNWNQAWNEGYNNSVGANPYTGYAASGYAAGQAQYAADKAKMATPSVQGAATTNTSTVVPQTKPSPGPAPTTPAAPTGGGTPDITSQLDAIFAPVMSALQGQESTAQNNYNIQTGDINQQGAAAQSTLDAQNTSGMSQLDQLGTTAGQTKSDALTAATELYNELSRGGQQRFGGSSSAGEAYGALTAVEQQKRQGAIQTAFSNAMDQVAQYKNTLLTNYTAAKTNLTSQINSQLASATQNFNDAISSIKTAEGQAASDKAQATLNTLQDYRNKVYTINLQGQQAMQALEQQGTVSMSAVDNYTQQMLTSLQNGSNTVVNMATSANNAAGTTKLGVGTAPTTTTLLPTGSTTTNNTTNNTTVANYVKYPHDGFTY